MCIYINMQIGTKYLSYWSVDLNFVIFSIMHLTVDFCIAPVSEYWMHFFYFGIFENENKNFLIAPNTLILMKKLPVRSWGSFTSLSAFCDRTNYD